jgi:hypothetical protein
MKPQQGKRNTVTDKLDADFCERHGLPEDTCVLVPVDDADRIPMRTPEGMTGMLVVAVATLQGMTTLPVALTDRTDKVLDVALFAVRWLTDHDDQESTTHHDGDVVIRLYPPIWQDGSRVDVQMSQLYQNRWQIVGTWYDVGHDWPHIVAQTANAVMGLHTDLCQAATPVTWVEPRTDLL